VQSRLLLDPKTVILTRLFTAPWRHDALHLHGWDQIENSPFDVIDTSNILDIVGILNILPAVAPLLHRNPLSVLHTDSLLQMTDKDVFSSVRRILCCDVDDPSGFQLLSMLKADCRTRTIPATTYVTWPLLSPVEMM